MEVFNSSLLKIIEKFSHNFYVVELDEKIKCSCLKAGTTQPDPKCPKCLGLGKKIKIKDVRGAGQDTGVPATGKATMQVVIARNYYIPSDQASLKMDDVIVDGDEVLFVYQRIDGRSFHGEKVYQKCMTVTKKLDQDEFLKNFNKIVGR